MADPQVPQLPDTETLDKILEHERKRLLRVGTTVFSSVVSQQDLLDRMSAALSVLQDMLKQIALRHVMTEKEMGSTGNAMLILAVTYRAMKHNPLYDTAAFTDQCLHHLHTVIRGASTAGFAYTGNTEEKGS